MLYNNNYNNNDINSFKFAQRTTVNNVSAVACNNRRLLLLAAVVRLRESSGPYIKEKEAADPKE